MSLALVQEYPLIHEKELGRGRERPQPVRRPFPHRPSNRFQPVRSSVSRACWSHADEESEDVCWEDEHEVNDDENDVSDDAAYWCQSYGPDGEFGDVVDRTEQDNVCVHSWHLTALSTMVPLSSDVNRHVSTVCMWKRSCTASDQNQNWRSRNVEILSSMRREIRQAEHVDGRAIGLVIKFVQISLGIDQHLAARRGHGTPVGAEMCRRQMKGT